MTKRKILKDGEADEGIMQAKPPKQLKKNNSDSSVGVLDTLVPPLFVAGHTREANADIGSADEWAPANKTEA